MLVEYISILSILVSGGVILRAFEFEGWILLPFGFICGSVIVTLAGYVQAILNVPSTFIFPLGFCAILLPAIILLVKELKKETIMINPLRILLSFSAVAVLVYFFYEANLFKFHFDSFRYLMSGSLLYTGNIDSISMNLLTKRFSSVSILHSLGNYSGNLNLHSVTPLFSISGLAILFWLTYNSFTNTLTKKILIPISLIGPVLLVSIHGYIWHSFYINGHLLFGVFLLTFVGSGWLLVRETARTIPGKGLVALQCFSIVGMVLTRPEGLFIAAIAIIPFVFTNKITFKTKVLLITAFGAAVILDQLFVIGTMLSLNRDIPLDRIGRLGIGFLSFASIPFFLINFNEKTYKFFPIAAEIFLWVALLFFFLIDPSTLEESISATFQNLVFNKGAWGFSIVLIAVISVISLLFCKFPDRFYLRYCLTAFIPLSLLFAYLRGSAYRAGVTDSLNRMIMQLLFLAVFFITVSLISSYLDQKKIKNEL